MTVEFVLVLDAAERHDMIRHRQQMLAAILRDCDWSNFHPSAAAVAFRERYRVISIEILRLEHWETSTAILPSSSLKSPKGNI